jgi:hypothetical protein
VRISGGAVFSLGVAAVAGYAVASAWWWPLKAALFPLVTGVPLLLLALLQVVLQLRAPEAPLIEERRRTLTTFGWMGGFIILVVLVGFPIAVPVFVFFYLATQASAGWMRSMVLSAVAWVFFHGLFERVLRFPFDSGLLGTWLDS